jgi:ribosomal protein L37AE/L43A
MFKCENPECSKEHDGSYGSGRFCCKQCKNRYIALTKINVKNPNVKAHLDKLRAEGRIQHRAPFGTWKCNHCNKIFETRYLLQKHIKDIHLKHTDGLICPFCRKIFKSF